MNQQIKLTTVFLVILQLFLTNCQGNSIPPNKLPEIEDTTEPAQRRSYLYRLAPIADTNHDGEISYDEFKAALAKYTTLDKSENELLEYFKELDTDWSGFLTIDELWFRLIIDIYMTLYQTRLMLLVQNKFQTFKEFVNYMKFNKVK